MKFSSSSEQLMSIMMNDFTSFIKKKTPRQQKQLDSILTPLYEGIKLSDRMVSLMWQMGKINVDLKEVFNYNTIKHSSLLATNYVPQTIQNYIKNNIKGVLTYTTNIADRNISIKFYLMNDRQFNQLKKFDKLAHKMFVWLKFASTYSSRRCSKILDIHCYMTPIKKMVPSSQFIILSPEHANTAVTTTCAMKGEICLYRTEEIFKVFIHETFHNFGLDFSAVSAHPVNQKMRQLFPINSDFNLYDAYSEFWATIMNCVVTSYFSMENPDDLKEFLIYCEFAIEYEQFFSLFQCVKILDFMGIFYSNLFNDDAISVKVREYLYKERTNIFSYYILKAILLFNATSFMTWCKKNNSNMIAFDRSRANLMRFFHFIRNHYKHPAFLLEIQKAAGVLRNFTGKTANRKHNIVAKTMRMSIVELE